MPIKTIYLIANPSSIFPIECAKYFQKNGLNVKIITRFSSQSEIDSIPIISSYEHEGRILRSVLTFVEPLLFRLERIITRNYSSNQYKIAMGSEQFWKPSFVHAIIWGFSISSFIKKNPPYFVYGQEAFSYGFATALCTNIPRFLWPWGGDIYLCAKTSFISKFLISYSLKNVDIITLSSISAKKYIVENFNVDKNKAYEFIWATGLTKIYEHKEFFSRSKLLKELNIPEGSKVIMNVRRFRPLWGAQIALESFIQLAIKYKNLYFIFIGGEGTEAEMENAIQRVIKNGLEDRFRFNIGQVSIDKVSRLMLLSDIYVSLMKIDQGDMRSSSIIQASAAGSVPVLSDQLEYREMQKLGFQALFIDPDDISGVIAACEKYLFDFEFVKETRDKNYLFIEKYQNNDKNFNEFCIFTSNYINSRNHKSRDITFNRMRETN